MVELVTPLGVPDTTPVEELMLKPLGNEGETVKVEAPPLFVTVKSVIAVPTVAAIAEVDKEITGALTYLITTTPDPPAPPTFAPLPADSPPPPPPPPRLAVPSVPAVLKPPAPPPPDPPTPAAPVPVLFPPPPPPP